MEIKPETERLVQEEIRSGRIHSIDELIVFAVHSLREKAQANHRRAIAFGRFRNWFRPAAGLAEFGVPVLSPWEV